MSTPGEFGAPLERRYRGGWLSLYPLAFGAGRLAVEYDRDGGRDGGYDEAYDFQDIFDAVRQFNEWDGEGEPEGWYRHRPTNRRRPGGDPEREEVRE